MLFVNSHEGIVVYTTLFSNTPHPSTIIPYFCAEKKSNRTVLLNGSIGNSAYDEQFNTISSIFIMFIGSDASLCPDRINYRNRI